MFVFNKDATVYDADEREVLKMTAGKRGKVIRTIADGGALPDDFTGVFLTYSQVNKGNAQRKAPLPSRPPPATSS